MGKKVNGNEKVLGKAKPKDRVKVAVKLKEKVKPKVKEQAAKIVNKAKLSGSKVQTNTNKSKNMSAASVIFAKPQKQLSPIKSTTSKQAKQKIILAKPKSPISGKGSTVSGVNSSRPKNEKNNSPSVGAIPKPSGDKSLLNIRTEVRLHGFSSLSTAVQKATPKVKHLLLNECDLIMECRSCRNLFRSVPNFISHKLNYCKELYHPASETGCSQFLNATGPSVNDVSFEYYVEPSSNKAAAVEGEATERCEHELSVSADKSIVIDETRTKSSLSLYNNIDELNDEVANNRDSNGTVKLALEKVNGRTDNVVYQTRLEHDPSVSDSSQNVFDNREVVDRDTAILGPDGKVICTGTSRGMEKIIRHLNAQIDLAQRKMMNSTNQFAETCDICKTVFTSEKALRQHRRDAPDCVKQSAGRSNDFSTISDTHESSAAGQQHRHRTTFVKQLFSKTSIDEAQKEEMEPMVLGSPNSKLSYKKTVIKAVKNLNHSTMNWKKFPCVNCTATFCTTREMSEHLATSCVGRVQSKPSAAPKICIEARRSYVRCSDQELKPKSPESPAVPVIPSLNNGSPSSAVGTVVDVNCNVATSKGGMTNTLNEREIVSTLNSRCQDVSFTPTDENSARNHAGLPDGTIINPKVTRASPVEELSEPEADQIETVSNVTDSGISSSGTSEDNLDGSASPGPYATSVLPNLTNGGSRPDSRSKRKLALVDDRVLTQKNKTLKPTAGSLSPDINAKRVSIRNIQKSKATRKPVHRFIANKNK